MARLNEPPQPATESIDALKRRFVRQNREIAKVNSTQSVRIRNLDCEVSRLLGENLSLREENIKLQHEVEKNASRHVLAGVDNIKVQLEAKLSELGILVQELGKVRKTTDIRRAQKRRSINCSSPRRSSEQRIWKKDLTVSEATGGADGRLPPIVEDKYYPRRTLNPEELLGLTADPANITDSPDLGPPPVAHFEQGDPIKFDPSPEESSGQIPSADAEEAHPALSANLETRKKRRESSHRREGGTSRANLDCIKAQSSKEAVGVSQPLKSGAKRKLNVREEGETPGTIEGREDNVLQLNQGSVEIRRSENLDTKPTTYQRSKPNNCKTPLVPTLSMLSGKEKSVEAPVADAMGNRKALGPKSANSDVMNSLLKHGRTNSKDKVTEAKDDLARIVRERNRPKEKPQAKAARPPDKGRAAIDPTGPATIVKPLERPPETPAPLLTDLFSPDPSETSAPRADSRDTPPPPDLGPDTGTGSFGRASRRPRGNVNYAQPNLRDKMRRPTAELVDAVAAEERARQESIAKVARDAEKPVVIKQEETADGLPIWKTNEPIESHRTLEEPASPLGTKTGNSAKDLPPNIITDRRRRTVAPVRNDEESRHAKGTSGAASTIAALTGGNHRPKGIDEERIEKDLLEETKQDAAEKSNIYDFTGSSPNNCANEDTQSKEEVVKSSRSSRRHSTVPASLDQSKGTLSISRRGERRKESVLGGRQQEESVGTVGARPKSVLELREGGEESVAGRGERAASRRRSMML